MFIIQVKGSNNRIHNMLFFAAVAYTEDHWDVLVFDSQTKCDHYLSNTLHPLKLPTSKKIALKFARKKHSITIEQKPYDKWLYSPALRLDAPDGYLGDLYLGAPDQCPGVVLSI